MNLSKKQTAIILTALNDYSSEAYINGKNDEMIESQNIIKGIEEEMEKGNNDPDNNVGSETGIEREYFKNCEVCDD